MTNLNELDGTWDVNHTTDYAGPLKKRSDGETTITNGETNRVDEAGVKWTSKFEIIDDTKVKMTSTADPSEADADFMLTNHRGEPTEGPVTYEVIFDLKRKDDKMQMTGRIEYGNETVFLTMRKGF